MKVDVLQLAQKLIAPAEDTVRAVGEYLAGYRGPLPKDVGFHRGHEANEIDVVARNLFISELALRFPDYDGVFWTEDQPVEQKFLPTNGTAEEERLRLLFVIDECEGTTNMKRWLHSPLHSGYRPDTGVSMAISMTENLGDLAIGAFCDMRTETGKLGQVLHDGGFRVYGGCRASGVDLVSILNNQFDAYVDLRAFLPRVVEGKEMNAQLQVYEVCGTLPIMVGCGLRATDPFGEPYYKHGFRGKIPLVVSRPTIHERILSMVRPFAEAWKKELEG